MIITSLLSISAIYDVFTFVCSLFIYRLFLTIECKIGIIMIIRNSYQYCIDDHDIYARAWFTDRAGDKKDDLFKPAEQQEQAHICTYKYIH